MDHLNKKSLCIFFLFVFAFSPCIGRDDEKTYNNILRSANDKIFTAHSQSRSSQQFTDVSDNDDNVLKEISKISLALEKFLMSTNGEDKAGDLSIESLLNVNENEMISQCENDTMFMLTNLLSRSPWALQMLDAFGKPSSGILKGNMYWLGDYDECISITVPRPNSAEFRGKYCSTFLVPPNKTAAVVAGSPPTSPDIGVCLPHSCNASQIEDTINTILKNFNVTTLMAYNTQCQEDIELDTRAVVAIVICSIFLFFITLGTMLDVYLKFYNEGETLKLPSVRAKSKYGSTNSNNDDEKRSLLVSSTDSGTEAVEEQNQKTANAAMPQGTFVNILLAFSVYTNGAKILNTSQSKDSLPCIHGIRFISMSWVILGHSCAFVLGMSDNSAFLLELIKRRSFSAIVNATVSVDTFFTLSGLLVAYIVLGGMKKSNGKISWFMFYFHRFWRLTPVYMMVLMIDVCLLRFMGSGPFWQQQGFERGFCNETWWTNLLYINNLVRSDEQCFGWAWYLANDMQFYVLSPLLLLPLYYSKQLGIAVAGLFLFFTWLTTGLISRINNLPTGFVYRTEGADLGDTMTYMKEYYFKPYCRMGPYIIGLLTGYILLESNRKIKLNKWKNLVGWTLAAVCASLIVYGLYDYANGSVLDKNTSAFYNTVHRTMWGVCICWVIVSCDSGYGGFINTILSWKGFIPLSRLTYCAYLVHPIIMFGNYLSLKKPVYLNDMTLINLFLSNMVLAYGIAFIVSLVFEAPMMGLEKALFKRK